MRGHSRVKINSLLQLRQIYNAQSLKHKCINTQHLNEPSPKNCWDMAGEFDRLELSIFIQQFLSCFLKQILPFQCTEQSV